MERPVVCPGPADTQRRSREPIANNFEVTMIISCVWSKLFRRSSPRVELIRIPAGEFLMGSDPEKDKEAYSSEQPQHIVYLPEFCISKYPVTNAQYAAFVQSTGHKVPEHWNDEGIPSGKEKHPVRYISWDDAVAFCEWLNRETGKDFQLPSEAEWEKAARGTDGRIYPWGDEPPTADLCNFDDNVGNTTPVGRYSPEGDSPYGCVDMASNVWEWTRSLYDDYTYPYDPEDGREDVRARGMRVLRGSSFEDMQDIVRCASRGGHAPYVCFGTSGFRVMVPS